MMLLISFCSCTGDPKFKVGECFYERDQSQVGNDTYYKIVGKSKRTYLVKVCQEKLADMRLGKSQAISDCMDGNMVEIKISNFDSGKDEKGNRYRLTSILCDEIK